MKLRDLLKDVSARTVRGDDSIEITSVTADSRQCSAGSLFVAVPGLSVDGAKFIDAALKKGAVAVVSEIALPSNGLTVVETDDARAALSLIAANFYGRPAGRLAIAGVTGTSGKTTTTKMIESILDATGEPVGLIGTIEYRAGDEREIADRTTPDAVVLQQWFAKMVAAGVRNAVMEVSSHALALRRTHGVKFAVAVFTNLSRDHFDFHSDFEDYYSAKRILFDQIDRSKRCAVVNVDDPYGARLANELGAAALTFGAGPNAAIHPAGGFRNAIEGLEGDLVTPSGNIRVKSALVGLPNLSNFMGAVGAALLFGIDPRVIERGIASLGAVRGRFEPVAGEDGLMVIIDYAHKPDALEKLLHAVRELAPERRLVAVFGCGGDRDQGKRPLMGEIAGRLADHTVLTSDNPRSESPEAILAQIEQGIRKVGEASYAMIEDRRAAIAETIANADPASVIVVAGKGHENYQVVGDRIIHFDDREEVELALRKRADKSIS